MTTTRATAGQPTLREVLEFLDGEIDRFNGAHDKGPTDHFLYPRRAVWRRPMKYEAESYNECLQAFFDCCSEMSIAVSEADGLLEAMETSLRLEGQDGGEPITEEEIARTVKMHREDFEARPDLPIRAENGHWLRLIAWVKPELPAPVAAWGQFMEEHLERSERSFSGGSKNWTRENHEDGNAPYRSLLRGLMTRGWYEPGQPASEHDAELAKGADRELMKRNRIVPASEVPDEYLFDPLTLRWRLRSEIGNMVWNNKTKIIYSLFSWTEEESRLANQNHRKLQDGELEMPPRPAGEQPVT